MPCVKYFTHEIARHFKCISELSTETSATLGWQCGPVCKPSCPGQDNYQTGCLWVGLLLNFSR